jgi:4-amino-4-deoxy-L-arabinose transferase-like glycosyltransferase
MVPRSTRAAFAVLAIVAVVVMGDNVSRPLANPDEGRYSEISREMAASGDWVTPRLNGIKYFEKPPLQYWASAASLSAFGNTEFAARLYVGLAGLAAALILGFTALRLGGSDFALASVTALISSPYFLGLGGIVTLDMGLTLWTTATFCAWLLAESSREGSRERLRWMLAAWAAMALAVLSKGLVGIVFPVAALFITCVLRRDFSPVRRLEIGYGLIVFLAIAAPWFVAVSMANPEFPEFFFVHEHFTRFLTTEHRRTEPWWYFLPILVAGFLPWMFALPAAVGHAWRTESLSAEPRPLRFALAWSAFIVGFFSLSGSKLPAYILPAFPPLALVIGRYLADAPAKQIGRRLAPLPLIALVAAYFAWNLPERPNDEWTRALYQAARPYALGAVAALFGASLGGAILCRYGQRWLAIVVVALGSVLMIEGVEDAYEELAPRQSGAIVAEKMAPLLAPTTRLYSVRMYDQTVPFYIGRTLTLVDYVDEFKTGLESEPGRHLESVGDFVADWLRDGDAMAIIQPDFYQVLRSWGLPMRVVHEDPRRVLVRKP